MNINLSINAQRRDNMALKRKTILLSTFSNFDNGSNTNLATHNTSAQKTTFNFKQWSGELDTIKFKGKWIVANLSESEQKWAYGDNSETQKFETLLYYPSFIEGLFHRQFNDFVQVCQKITGGNDAGKKKQLINLIDNSNLKGLLRMDTDIRKNLNRSIGELESYAEKTSKNKADIIKGIVPKLKRHSTWFPENNSETPLEKVLMQKLEFVKTLFSQNQVLSKHRDPRLQRILYNVLTAIFTGFTANVINYFVTGNFWFAKETGSQLRINQIAKCGFFPQPAILPQEKAEEETGQQLTTQQTANQEQRP